MRTLPWVQELIPACVAAHQSAAEPCCGLFYASAKSGLVLATAGTPLSQSARLHTGILNDCRLFYTHLSCMPELRALTTCCWLV